MLAPAPRRRSRMLGLILRHPIAARRRANQSSDSLVWHRSANIRVPRNRVFHVIHPPDHGFARGNIMRKCATRAMSAKLKYSLTCHPRESGDPGDTERPASLGPRFRGDDKSWCSSPAPRSAAHADEFSATAARMRAFNAFSSILSPSWISMARLVLPSREVLAGGRGEPGDRARGVRGGHLAHRARDPGRADRHHDVAR